MYVNVCSCMSAFDFALWLNSQIKSVQLKIINHSLSLPFQENKDCSTVIKWKESYEQPATKKLCKKNNFLRGWNKPFFQTEAPYQIFNFCFVEKVSWLWHKPKRIPHFLPELSDIFGWRFPHYLILHPLLLCFLPCPISHILATMCSVNHQE